MQKILTWFTVILLLSLSAYAAGSSAGAVFKESDTGEKIVNCEGFEIARNRIKCRLENDVSTDGAPEPCRGLASVSEDDCATIYSASLPCYDKKGTSKDKCFKGLLTEKNSPSKKRWYIVLLLYELEEYVEESFEDGNIEVIEAADLINEIVNIKKDVLNEKPKANIQSSIASFRKTWQSVIS
ncbi:MAG: hypothetical protein QF632_06420 [Candidatus Woesearchaeota archaeon]|jgi:hypothetical protein|nr:hypothetical protein [Candidatus Woesearchaeota archaeon]MDP7324369.1 hypothetical protein [Candidatus Woesearchaeota archaeon]MDP7457807.1 hypothetical protein [Candidatus Woesearchaeota archaeon]